MGGQYPNFELNFGYHVSNEGPSLKFHLSKGENEKKKTLVLPMTIYIMVFIQTAVLLNKNIGIQKKVLQSSAILKIAKS